MTKENMVTATAHAYTPGLKVTKETLVLKIRKLPVPGELLVKVGDNVEFNQSVAKAYLPGEVQLVKVTSVLGLEPEDCPFVLKKKVGDHVEKDEMIAECKAFFGLVKKSVSSPLTGVLESVSDETGRVLIRGAPQPIEISAYISGKVVDTIPREAAIIETNAAFLQGIFGVGGETYGEIKMAVKSPDEELKIENISAEDKGKIIVGGSIIRKEALRKALDIGVKGIVVGGIQDADLFDCIGMEIGVAITGNENIKLSLIITEGFGKMNMSERSFNLLKEFEGYRAMMNGATQIRAGVQRPEVIIPHQLFGLKSSVDLSDGMVKGTPVRIIRKPYFGALGRVVGLPIELQKLQSESKVRVVDVEIDGKIVTVPRANVEIIEE